MFKGLSPKERKMYDAQILLDAETIKKDKARFKGAVGYLKGQGDKIESITDLKMLRNKRALKPKPDGSSKKYIAKHSGGAKKLEKERYEKG